MNPTEIVGAVLSAAPGALFVASLGTPTSALRAASDDGPHLYMGGSMGTALAAALGVAEKRPERDVVALLGDGETLMGAGLALEPRRPRARRTCSRSCSSTATTRSPAASRSASPTPSARSPRRSASPRRPRATPTRSRAHVRELPRPALLEVRYDERAWPGPSPFVDPPVVRWRFERRRHACADDPAVAAVPAVDVLAHQPPRGSGSPAGDGAR